MYLEVKCKVQTKSLFSLNRKYSPLPIGKYSGRNVWCTSAKLPNLATQQSEKVEQKHLEIYNIVYFFFCAQLSLLYWQLVLTMQYWHFMDSFLI